MLSTKYPENMTDVFGVVNFARMSWYVKVALK
jgi:hypothetical protein